MRKHALLLILLPTVLSTATAPTGASDQATSRAIATNKDKLVTLAVQGQIAPAQPSTPYVTTWDGKPKMAIGIGGINYNLRIGDKVFGWASGDRATVGVATEGADERSAGSWLTYTSIGNEVRVLGGDARGQKGVIVGKFGSYVLVHFDEATLDQLTVGDRLHVKAQGIGLEIQGFKEVFAHSIAPELLEKILSQASDGALEAPVVKVIPGEIVGQGAGRGSLFGNWHIQTCFPPDVKKHGLDQLRFGDLVLLQDVQTDFGMGYFKGGATLGVVVSGPSDISGLGIGVTPMLSTRSVTIRARLDASANIGKFLGLAARPPAPTAASAGLKTNRDKLIATAVEGVVQPAGGADYTASWDGNPKLGIGMASINYSVSVGDPVYGWISTDHVEPDVTIQGRDKPRPSDCALAILACIGNEARVVSGEAKGGRGVFVGRHAGSDDIVWFPRDVLEKLTLNDRIQIRAQGVGLKIEGFDDVRVNKLSPDLLEKLGITVSGGQLVVPVAAEVPGHIMGSGMGGFFLEPVDYDIQTTDPRTVDEYNLKGLRLGDVVAIRDHYDYWGRGRYEGAITIGVIVHGWSDYSGHGPGVNPILSALPGKIVTRKDADANIAYYLGIRQKGR